MAPEVSRRPELVIFVGLPGSGKSSFYQRRLAATHAHVSKDLLRNNSRPQRRQLQLIDEALAAGRSVAVDNTNPAPADRAPLVALARAHGAEVVGYAFESIVADCVARNERREGRAKVPRVAIYTAAKRLVPPSHDEGFDRLHLVRMSGDDFAVTEIPRAPTTDVPLGDRSDSH